MKTTTPASAAGHSPTPWKYCKGSSDPCTCGYIFTSCGTAYLAKVLDLNDGVDPVCGDETRAGNLAHILRCVNEREELLAALGELTSAVAVMDTSYKTTDFLPGKKNRRYHAALSNAQRFLARAREPLA